MIIWPRPEVANYSTNHRLASTCVNCPQSPERVVAAAKQAGAHEFIAGLPQGYDSVVSELGLTLSGGQRQRIGIARALYREPRIVILDEATSNLDQQSERALEEMLECALFGRTCLIIAHNTCTTKAADWILVLDGGCIVEQGTHAELLAKPGVYSSLTAGNNHP